MTAIEAMVYCLGYVNDEPEDGDYQSQKVYDRNGDAHWFGWPVNPGDRAMPTLCSGSLHWNAFARCAEPYTISRVEGD